MVVLRDGLHRHLRQDPLEGRRRPLVVRCVTVLFLVAFALGRIERLDGRFTRPAAITFALLPRLPRCLPARLLQPRHGHVARAVGEGDGASSLLHFLFLVAPSAFVARRGERFYWQTLAAFCVGVAVNAVYGVLQLGVAAATRAEPRRRRVLSPLTGGASQINVYGAIQGAERLPARTRSPAIRTTSGSSSSPLLVLLLPIYLRLERGHRLRLPLMVLLAFLLVIELATLSRSGLLGLVCGLARPRRPVSPAPAARPGSSSRSRSCCSRSSLSSRDGRTSSRGAPLTGLHGGAGRLDALRRLRVHPSGALQHPLFGLGLNNFSVYYEFVTGRDNFGPHSFYVALIVESGLVGALLFPAFLGYLFHRLARARADRSGARGGRRPARRARAAARVGPDRGAGRDDGLELLLPDDELLLLLRLRDARDRRARRVRPQARRRA